MRSAIYIAVAGGIATCTATLAASPFHGQVRGLVFVVVGIVGAALIGALTPRHTTQGDST